MTVQSEPIGTVERSIQLEKHLSPRGSERWVKQLSPLYPAADYWLCHEARLFQAFQRDPRCAARFIAVDLDRRTLTLEADGHPLTHWLATGVGELEHPFQRSSELVRLILACLRAVAQLAEAGVVHGGLRPDVLILRQNERGEIDYGSLRLIDFSVAHSALYRIEKPLFVDLASPDAAYISPAMREAVTRDWRAYAKLIGEKGKSGWYELSDLGKRQYDTLSMPDLAVNLLDWRSDLFSLGHWFRQISLHRIDYYKDSHQEALPSLIKRMQKPLLQGGFTSLEACIRAFEALEVDPRPMIVAAPPHTAGVMTMHPLPVLHPITSAQIVTPAVRRSDDTPPAPPRRRQRAEADEAQRQGRLVGIGIGLMAVAAVGAVWLSLRADRPTTSAVPTAEAPATTSVGSEQRASLTPTPIVEAQAPATVAFEGLSLEDLSKAAEAGNPAAQTQLGLRYRKGQGVPADHARAVAWYRRAADQGHADAQAYLGFMYMTGKGIRRDDREAVRWSRLAAEQGNGIGQFNLGLLYLAGRGVAQDRIEAHRWLSRAAEHEPTARAKLVELQARLTPTERARLEAPPTTP
ncbi:hypothetical protein [Chitinimonas lacunae]|uniref:Protein kinase domain-containing protein n=1 Tax=Chitinimonas lacunae TaxID=1963018 RepID=A0ABV8MQA4_9NEIS